MQPKPTPNRAFHNFGELRNYEKIPKKGDVSENLPKGLIHGYYVSVSYIDTQIGLVLDKLDELGLAENTIVVLLGDHGWNIEDHKLWSKHVTFKTALRTPIIIKVPGKTNGEKSNYITEFIDIYSTLCELAGIEIPKTVEGKSFVPIIKGKKSNKK